MLQFICFCLLGAGVGVGIVYLLYLLALSYFYAIKSIAPESNKMYYGIHAFVFATLCIFIGRIFDKCWDFCAQSINGAGDSTGTHFNNIRNCLCGYCWLLL